MTKKALCALFLASATLAASAQQILEDNLQRLQVRYETPSVHFTSMSLDGQKYAALNLEGYTLGGEVGAPALPVMSRYIATPFCSGIEVSVANAVYDTFQLSEANFRFYPMQPARSKSDSVHRTAFDRERYAADAPYGMPLATVQPLGIERDRNLARLSFAPVTVNPVSGQVIVCRSADITVSYIAPDVQRSLDHYALHHTPAFVSTATLNAPFAKATVMKAPLRMLIVAGDINGIRQSHSLHRFVEWKRSQGMLVDVLYTSDLSSNTTSAIATAIKQYNIEATAENPAPTYLILIGDHAQLPAFDCQLSYENQIAYGWSGLNDHVSDHYYTTWTDDNIRDCYLGRFSVTDTNQLNNIINKTLLYEKYEFADDSYLARAVLIAGVDNGRNTDRDDNAWRCADPTMDYVARYYINAANGYSDVTYYKNNTAFAPAGVTVTGSSQDGGTSAILRALYDEGIGWINYSAHGFERGWGSPQFYNNEVNQMTNNGKPSFMIGNCCLSNHFNTNACFGETLLRKGGNAGAIGYIGGTNSTFWDQDFYFSVGVRNNISNTMNASYDAANLGSYDRLFHSHGESFSSHAITAGAIVHAGLMAVNSHSTNTLERDMIEYYWEIYELMGDPSLMPWLGTASQLTATATVSDSVLTVETDPYAYVAVVDQDLTLVAAAFAGPVGRATMELPAGRDLANATISITAQNRNPFSMPFSSASVDIGSVDMQGIRLAPNPATDRCDVQADGLSRVQLLDLMGRTLIDQPCSGTCTLNLYAIPSGLYLVRMHTASGVSVSKLQIVK